MGEAKRRGTYEKRRIAAIKRDKKQLIKLTGDRDEHLNAALQAGLRPFLARMTTEEWQARRGNLLDYLKIHPQKNIGLAEAQPVRVRADEIGWYLFLCEQTLNDPMCVDISQQQRILPFFVGIGERWVHSPNVKGLERKIDELLRKYKSAPDGLIFEILVALSYAAAGWDVALLEEQSSKTPDMAVLKNGRELYVECKRLERRTAYAETERTEFLRLWDKAVQVLVANRQWVWMKGIFHAEASSLPADFLANILQKTLPIGKGELLIHDDANATIYARLIDIHAVQRHMANNMVKLNSPMLSSLLGGDWAPENSAVTIAPTVKLSHVVDCEVPILGAYVQEIGWASGFTREFDSEISIDKKARDVIKHLSDAVKQVPKDKPSVIHIAAETLEGKDVERRRTEKVWKSIASFITDRPVLGVRFHRFLSNQRKAKLFEFDETVEKFQIPGANLEDIPEYVVAPNDAIMVHGHHWEIYP